MTKPLAGDTVAGHTPGAVEHFFAIEYFLGDAENFELADDSAVDASEAGEALEALRALFKGLTETVEKLKAKLALFVDRAEYGDSYGVEGSSFQCCHYCRGGGAPGISLVHEPSCPVAASDVDVEEWLSEHKANEERWQMAVAAGKRVEALYAGALKDAECDLRVIDNLSAALERAVKFIRLGNHPNAGDMLDQAEAALSKSGTPS